MNKAIGTSRKHALPPADAAQACVKRQRVTSSASLAGCVVGPTDHLSRLPDEVLTAVLKHVAPNPLQNVQLQQVSRRLCRLLRDDTHWLFYAPEQHRAPDIIVGSMASARFGCADAAAKPLVRDTLYREFQQRTARGENAYTLAQQARLRDLWRNISLPFVAVSGLQHYDLARAATEGYCPFGSATYTDDAPIMLRLAEKGPEQLGYLSHRLKANATFMYQAVLANNRNYGVAAPTLQQSDAFNRSLLRSRGALLPQMPAHLRGDRAVVLKALATWHVGHLPALSPSPYASLSQVLQQDLGILKACIAASRQSFVDATQLHPQQHFGRSRQVVQWALTPRFVDNLWDKQRWDVIVRAIAPELRDAADIGRMALRCDPATFAHFSGRLQNDVSFCSHAVSADSTLLRHMSEAMRENPAIIASLTPAQRLSHLSLLRTTIGARKDLLLALLANPAAKEGRKPYAILIASLSILRHLSPALLADAEVIDKVLRFDAREYALWFGSLHRSSCLGRRAADYLIAQLRAEDAQVPLRSIPMFAQVSRVPSRNGLHVTFSQDPYFAVQLLTWLPQCVHLVDASIRKRLDLTQLARLGCLLQEIDGTYTTRHTAYGLLRQLRVERKRFASDFVLDFTAAMIYVTRCQWYLARPILCSTLAVHSDVLTPRQNAVRQSLALHMPSTCPKRDDTWYRAAVALARALHRQRASHATMGA